MRRLLFFVVCLFGGLGLVRADDAVLPSADWYAVVWQGIDDSLHWVNADGEQASIARPHLPGEADANVIDLHISPDQRVLVLAAQLTNGNHGIGFYDLQRGQFLRTHEAQPGELLVRTPHEPLSRSADRFASALYRPATGAWRLIDFDLATGDALAQLTSADPDAPRAASLLWWPQVILYEGDSAAASVHVQFVTTPSQFTITESASFVWHPTGAEPVEAGRFHENEVSGFDVESNTGQVVSTVYDSQAGEPPDALAATTLTTRSLNDPSSTPLLIGSTANLQNPRWLNGGTWVGFQVRDEDQSSRWAVIPAAGSGEPFRVQRIELPPEFSDVQGTPDGYLAVDLSTGTLFHQTALTPDSLGTPVFQTEPGVLFQVAHVTPLNLPVAATTLANAITGQTVQPSATGTSDAAPLPQPPAVECPGAPSPRLAVGMQARVNPGLSQPLRVRVEPGSGLVTGLNGGAQVEIIGGPVCLNRILWWELRLAEGVTGWSAEASGGSVFLEPVALDLPDAAANPPSERDSSALPSVPAVCANAPALSVRIGGEYRVRVGGSGTLAFRSQSADTYPSRQLVDDQRVTVVDGPLCYDGYRMWQVETTINEERLTGWVFDGAYDRVYLVAP